jgi:tetratricopeptide (TPR) repeat protein
MSAVAAKKKRRKKRSKRKRTSLTPALWTPLLLQARKSVQQLSAWLSRVTDRAITLTARSIWPLVAFVVVALLLFKLTERTTISIQSISVPKTLSEHNGITPEVAAARLRDALYRKITAAKTVFTTDLDQQHKLPDITIPNIGITIDSAVQALREVFSFKSHRRVIAAEITLENGSYLFVARVNGKVTHINTLGTPNIHEINSKLFDVAALDILRETRPFVAAAYIHQTFDNREMALREISKILTGLPETDENVPWMYNLIGHVHFQARRFDLAEFAFKKAIQLEPNLAVGHNSLGYLAFHRDKNYQLAVWHVQRALRIEPTSARIQRNLAEALQRLHAERYQQGYFAANFGMFATNFNTLDRSHLFDDSIALYRSALSSNVAAEIYGIFAEALVYHGDIEDAVELYRAAIVRNQTTAGDWVLCRLQEATEKFPATKARFEEVSKHRRDELSKLGLPMICPPGSIP